MSEYGTRRGVGSYMSQTINLANNNWPVSSLPDCGMRRALQLSTTAKTLADALFSFTFSLCSLFAFGFVLFVHFAF